MLTWPQIEIIIPTVLPARRDSLTALLCQIAEQCPGAQARVVPRIAGEPPSACVAQIFGPPTPSAWRVLLEDDVLLAPTFGSTVLNALRDPEARADALMSFFALTEEKEDGWHKIAPSRFYNIQCIALCPHHSEAFARFYPLWRAEHPEHILAHDLALAAFCRASNIPIWRYQPSQVQHRALPSTLGPRSTHRQSPSFVRVYGERAGC